MNQVIQGDCLEVLPQLPKAKMIFADPPDNLGAKYDGFEDKWETEVEYFEWLMYTVVCVLRANPEVFWFSYYWLWDFELKGRLWPWSIRIDWRIKPFVWRFTFGQHRIKDCGNGYRPLLRFSKSGMVWNTDSIRVESERQRLGDKRANPCGRVPDDVWEFPRVCGNFHERRKWVPNQHPEALIERMVLMSTNPGDLVIDMFAGSGTVHRVCKRLGRDSISIEISPTYCEKILEEDNESQQD